MDGHRVPDVVIFYLDRPNPPHRIPSIVLECEDVLTASARVALVGVAAFSVVHEDGDNGGQRLPPGDRHRA